MIDVLELWDDTGYTESGVERPPVGATLSHPDHMYEDLRPDKDKVFSRVTLRVPYTEVMNTSYLRATYETNNGDDLIVYGWVDSVELMSDTEGFPMVAVNWHPDLWRTWARQAVFRTGTVMRRPATASIPPQPYPYRYRLSGAESDLIPLSKDVSSNDVWWCYMSYTGEYDGGNTTGLDIYCFPCSMSTHLYITDGTNTGDSPSLIYAFNGLFDECLGLTPSRIGACFLSPIAPKPYTGDGSNGSPMNLHDDNAWNLITHEHNGHTFACYHGGESGANRQSYKEFSGTYNGKTDDISSKVVTGFRGEPLAVMPWGLSLGAYTYRMVVDALSCYISVRFGGIQSEINGTTVNIPCIPISVTGNSWSEYEYTGLREYDIEMRELAQRKELMGGLMGTLTSTTSAVGLGMMFGGVKGRNLMRGAGATAGGGIASSLISYGLANFGGLRNGPLDEWQDFNGQEQKWLDYASAHQSENLVIPGSGWDCVLFGRTVKMVSWDTDQYSQTQRATDMELYGAHVSEPMASCQSLINAGGPLQIVNLTVGGDIPVEAKEYMRAMFSNGVRLV